MSKVTADAAPKTPNFESQRILISISQEIIQHLESNSTALLQMELRRDQVLIGNNTRKFNAVSGLPNDV